MKHKKLQKRIILWAAIITLLAGGIWGLVKISGGPQNETASLLNSISGKDWTKGNKNSQIILVEYSDFQCPACASYYPLVKQASLEFSEKMQFTYRHFPLMQIHANAELASRAAEAAGKQGKFWEMHDLIFERQDEWSKEYSARKFFIEFAKSLNLDMEKFVKDLDSDEIKEKVTSDYQGGLRSKVNSTPTFFLNGKKIKNPRSYDELKSLIRDAANQKI